MTLHIPDRNPKGMDNYTIRGTAISARTGLAYCEIARGTSGRQKAWFHAALYCPAQSDPAYYPGGRHYDGPRWSQVGFIYPAGHRGFKMTLHRAFNPGPSFDAVVHHHSASDLRVLMEHILEKWYG